MSTITKDFRTLRLSEKDSTNKHELDVHRSEQSLSRNWKRAISACCESLERDDLRQVSVFNSWDDLQKQLLQGQERRSAQQEFSMLTPGLMKLKTFTNVYMSRLVPSLDTSIIPGMIWLVIKLAQEEDAAANRVPRMLREICYKIGVLNGYCAGLQCPTSQLRELCVETGLNLLSFVTHTVEFFRSDIQYLTRGNALENEWQPLATEYNSTLQAITSSISRIERISQATTIPARGDDDYGLISGISLVSKQPSQQEEIARLPCIVLPAIRTSRFFDGTDVILKIEKYFQEAAPSRAFRSLAIHGPGGVGKTSVALKYAEAQLRKNELDALFWIYSEKLVSIRQSFTAIAMRLRLPDARAGDHEENYALVLNWLQTTQCRWLIVYDNAEDIDLVRSHWPAANQGQALITTRNRTFAFEPAHGGLEITTWDTETGSRFLIHLLSTDIGMELREDDTASARELSQKLSGHALAISHLAGLIHRRSRSIAEFVKIYNQHPSEMHGISENSSINALWDFAFKSLDDHSRAILGVLCFVAPDSIPQSLFEGNGAAELPESLAFCADRLRFSEVIENLLALALLNRDKTSHTFSLHRLVQTSYKYFMSPEERQRRFNDAAVILSRAFPRRDTALAQLYLMWERCSLYLQHVLALKDCFREETKANHLFSAPQTYCDMNNACQRYLLEINSYTDLEDLLAVNTLALKTLPEQDQTAGLQGSLTSHTGQLLCRLGKAEEGIAWLKKSYDIRSCDIPFNPRESAWAAGNASNGLATSNDFVEAVIWQEKARDHWLEWSHKQEIGRGEWPAMIKNDLGTILVWAGSYTRAREVLQHALRQIESAQPYNWAVAAYVHFGLGNLDRRERLYDAAEAHFMEAQNAWSKGGQLRTAPFNAATMYKLGCTALDQGKMEAALKHLRDARAVTALQRNTLVAEHARVLFKMSEVLEQEPREQNDAIRLRAEAENLLKQRNNSLSNAGLESTYDALVCIHWR